MPRVSIGTCNRVYIWGYALIGVTYNYNLIWRVLLFLVIWVNILLRFH